MNKETARLIELSAKASGISPARAKRLYSKLPHHARSAFKDGMRKHLLAVTAKTLCFSCRSDKASPVPVIHNGEHGVIYSCDDHKAEVATLEGFTVVPDALAPLYVPDVPKDHPLMVGEKLRENAMNCGVPPIALVPADFVGMHPDDKKAVIEHVRSGFAHIDLNQSAEDVKATAETLQTAVAPRIGLPGTEEGDCCNRGGCDGEMGYRTTQGCSCNIAPPCSACVENPLVCLICGANPEDDEPEEFAPV